MAAIKKFLAFIDLISLNVVLATGVCAAAFFKLPDGRLVSDWVSLSQIMLSCWLVYILDRILDVLRNPAFPDTARHQFHFKHQYNLQIFAIALALMVFFLLVLQPLQILVYGSVLSAFIVFYLWFIVPKFPKLKSLLMPLIYVAVVVGVPFVLASSINLSSWVVAFVFLIVVYQNLLTFDYFEDKISNAKNRKWVTYLGAFNLFIAISLFVGNSGYTNHLGCIFAAISLAYSFIINNETRFRDNYRWLMDGLLFLPILIF